MAAAAETDVSCDGERFELGALDPLVSEPACASGQEMGDRLLGPQVVMTDHAVLLAFAVIPLEGAQSCQGILPAQLAVTLDEPLGEREVRDGRFIGRIDELVTSR